MIPRQIQKYLLKSLNDNKIELIIGPRCVGKTSLLKEFLKEKPHLYLNA